MARKRQAGAGDPGEGEPDSRREGSPEPGSPAAAPAGGQRRGRRAKKRGRGRPPGRSYSPEERRRLLEMHEKSGMTLYAFAATVDVAPQTLATWRRAYAAGGPKALEPKAPGRPKGSGAGSQLPEVVQAAVVETRRRFPFFGAKRIGDWLRRFRGIAVSPGAAHRVLGEVEPPIPVESPPLRRRRRRHPKVKHFERASAGQLWQTDITSFVLTRHRVRVYLVAFIDDYSRYVVAWALGTSQTKEFVVTCLMDGVAKYGKPETVLSDQGPQYYAWRGKSRFEKVLEREGIKHSVARSHHPQTVGKCERLWQSVAKELWNRVHPQELDEARARLKDYFNFYNFFRPHQGIDGGIPAERFFGAAEAVKRQVAERITKNALREALGEKPRKGLYAAWQVGDKSYALHGEGDEVVFHSDEGTREALGLADLGMPKKKEESDGGAGGGEGPGGTTGDGPEPEPGDGGKPAGDGGAGDGGDDDGDDGDGIDEEEAPAGPLPPAPAGGGGAGAVVECDGGGEEEGARGGGGDPRLVAGSAAQGGGDGAAPGEAAAAVATQPDGALGDGGRAPEAAEEEGDGAAGGSRGGVEGGAEEEGDASGAGPSLGAGAGDPAPDAAVVEEGCDPTRYLSRSGSGSERSSGPEGTQSAGSGPCSPGPSQ
jgi:transposase InsO family protein